MVKYIHHQHYIDARVIVGDMSTVEVTHGNGGVRADQYVEPFDANVGSQPGYPRREGPIAASNIEDLRIAWNKRGDVFRKPGNTTAVNQATVQPAEQTHRRFIPRTLRKKLDSTVWKPSVVSVTPGMTQRIVWL